MFVNIPDLLDENQIMPFYIHHSNDNGKASISPATIPLQKMFMTLSLPSEIYLNTRSNAVGCCECHFYWFFIMNISVWFLEKVKIDMFYSFLYFDCDTLFFYRARNIPIFEKSDFHHQRSTLSLSSRHTLIWLPSLCCYTIYPYFTDELLDHFSDRFRPLWHPCSHSPLDYAQVPDNWLILFNFQLSIIYLI